jgi:glutamyl-tRNA synthetase
LDENNFMEKSIRVRFAPSPTGALHIGGVRTALYNYLLAKKHQGKFILRIEDTDQNRFVPGAEQYIVDTLKWLGIEPDEGIHQGGDFAPYRQSDRKDIYRKYADQLVQAGKAYYAFDTPEELEAMRERLQAAKVASPQYNAISREWMKNSLTLPQEEVAAKINTGEPYVIRFKMPHKETIRFYDQVRGWVKVETSTLDDKVLLKSDGMATYHLANVVDDYLMQISHVIRGEEWLPSAPLHILLYQAFDWVQAMPQFVHLPILLKPEGHGKLSKRDADKHGFPIFPIAWQDPTTGNHIAGFREKGYLPEALINFLALLGWSAGGDQELFTKEALIEAFSLERIGKSGVKFDILKANWFNQQYLRNKTEKELSTYLISELDKRGIFYTIEQAEQICRLVKERATFPQDFWEQGQVFFQAPTKYDTQAIQKRWTPQVHQALEGFAGILSTISPFEAYEIKESLTGFLKDGAVKINEMMPIIRIALMGTTAGPDLMQSMQIIGQEETVKRIKAAIKSITPVSI